MLGNRRQKALGKGSETEDRKCSENAQKQKTEIAWKRLGSGKRSEVENARKQKTLGKGSEKEKAREN